MGNKILNEPNYIAFIKITALKIYFQSNVGIR